ncbi:DEAD/DEAH box helicase [Pseudoalteromonas piscicida]|uniref:DEAD/DEAH box helicase n=1 Tax=Pseudoalteromonas piscicida TaxID=43662 RepID=UPI000E35D03E|nr:DEAD/DEAH box helicase [Pseudoalteromonas piscicida]AXQ98721.1 ATP-dependent RNA helicase RhlE [Pseudoalteromonas piscicida]
MSFSHLGLAPEINQAVVEQGYDKPTPIQEQAIPAILEGRDVMAAAQTGTGKTAGFTLPLLQKLIAGTKPRANNVRALILTPTRELADQVWQSVTLYSKHLPISSEVVYGGVKINPQMMKLRKGVDVLVATPGRLLDLYQQNAVKFDDLEVLVLDEADRMLDMGFIHDIKRIIKALPSRRQNLMFSATFSEEIRALAKGLIHDPVEVSVAPANSTAKSVTQWVYPVDKSKRTGLLKHLVQTHDWQQVLVFTRTKHGANRLVKDLEKDKINAAAIHGNKSQSARMKALAGFKNGEVRVLVATDIVARGLDIQELPHVVNFDLPNVYEDYVHRIGRTGRAGATGEAISFVTQETASDLFGIERLIQQLVPRKVEPGFEPQLAVPESKLDTRPIKPKKPKKPKKSKVDEAEQTPSAQPKNKPKQSSGPRNNKPSGNGKPASNNNGNRRRRPSSSANKPKSQHSGDKRTSHQKPTAGN